MKSTKNFRISMFFIIIFISITGWGTAQIPMERVLDRVTIPSEGDTRGLVDLVGFPYKAAQMDLIGRLCQETEDAAIRENQDRYGLDEESHFILGICPHDDYMLAARIYIHVQRYIKARTVILIGNAHWSEAFKVRNRLIFGNFKVWQGPFGPVQVSQVREDILKRLHHSTFVINRKIAETEHSIEALIPFLQYFNRDVEIIPVFIPFTDWQTMDVLGKHLADVVAQIVHEKGWKLGRDVAVLCSTDFQHYGDYGWSYYDYHPFGCDADGYKKATELDRRLVKDYLIGPVNQDRIQALFSELVDQEDIAQHKITWCGRFATPFAVNFAAHLTRTAENRTLNGMLLKYGTTLSDPWLPLTVQGLGLTGDANLHHFVTFASLGFR